MRDRVIRRITPNTRIIEHLLEKGNHDLEVSEKLVELGEYDWAYTSAYTAMLVAARGYMNKQGFRSSTSDGHVAVIRFLQASTTVFDAYLDIFDRMRRNRHRVMYDEYNIITLKTARQATLWAYEFIELIKTELK